MELTIHHKPDPNADRSLPDPHQDTFSKTIMGFWVYLMTDAILFSVLFITHAVLLNSTFGGPSGKELFSLRLTFAETMALLGSSLVCGFALLEAVKGNLGRVKLWLAATFVLGGIFLSLELHEFRALVLEGHDWTKSAFLSSFFVLVGTHGLHVTVGMLWLSVMFGQLAYYGLTVDTFRRLVLFNMFWHFLDLIWVFVFTFVYLLGVL